MPAAACCCLLLLLTADAEAVAGADADAAAAFTFKQQRANAQEALNITAPCLELICLQVHCMREVNLGEGGSRDGSGKPCGIALYCAHAARLPAGLLACLIVSCASLARSMAAPCDRVASLA